MPGRPRPTPVGERPRQISDLMATIRDLESGRPYTRYTDWGERNDPCLTGQDVQFVGRITDINSRTRYRQNFIVWMQDGTRSVINAAQADFILSAIGPVRTSITIPRTQNTGPIHEWRPILTPNQRSRYTDGPAPDSPGEDAFALSDGRVSPTPNTDESEIEQVLRRLRDGINSLPANGFQSAARQAENAMRFAERYGGALGQSLPNTQNAPSPGLARVSLADALTRGGPLPEMRVRYSDAPPTLGRQLRSGQCECGLALTMERDEQRASWVIKHGHATKAIDDRRLAEATNNMRTNRDPLYQLAQGWINELHAALILGTVETPLVVNSLAMDGYARLLYNDWRDSQSKWQEIVNRYNAVTDERNELRDQWRDVVADHNPTIERYNVYVRGTRDLGLLSQHERAVPNTVLIEWREKFAEINIRINVLDEELNEYGLIHDAICDDVRAFETRVNAISNTQRVYRLRNDPGFLGTPQMNWPTLPNGQPLPIAV